MMHPGHYSSDDADTSDTPSDSDFKALRQRLRQIIDPLKVITSHIAIHLQVLMLLILRFVALQTDDKTFVVDDLKSDCVEFDEDNSSSKSSDSGKLSDIDFRWDVAIEDKDDEDSSEVAKELNDDVIEDGIPDTDLNFDNIPSTREWRLPK